MRAKTNRIPVFLITAAGAAAGFLLRRWQLGSAYDEAGLMVSGQASTWVLGIACALLTVFLIGICRRLEPRCTYLESFSSGKPEMAVSLTAAALLLAGNALALSAAPRGAGLAVSFFGILSALCMAATAVQRFRGVVPSAVLHIAPCLYLVIKLIVDFKRWSVDPAVLDYCYELFAAIAAMCAVYHLGGFCFDKGRRRISAFWCMACLVFSAVSLADGGLSHGLLIGGLGLWAAVNGWQLFEP